MTDTLLMKRRFGENLIKGLSPVVFHIVVVALSAAIALSFPAIINFIAQNVLVYWSVIGNEKIFLISVEIVFAVTLILFSYYVSSSWKDRKLSAMARISGLILAQPTARGYLARRRIRRLKERQGFARDIMVISSTGYRTFADPKGDLAPVMHHCRAAKIMLLNPRSEGAKARAGSILDPGITPESFGEQIIKTIAVLKTLKAAQKEIKLKLYEDTPLLKLAILGDYLWIQHYHGGLDVQKMPKYVFRHDQNPGSLYVLFYQYFLARWNNREIPEYDFDTDELIYRDQGGNEVRRESYRGAKELRDSGHPEATAAITCV
jgi:hypothetical protein